MRNTLGLAAIALSAGMYDHQYYPRSWADSNGVYIPKKTYGAVRREAKRRKRSKNKR